MDCLAKSSYVEEERRGMEEQSLGLANWAGRSSGWGRRVAV